MKFNETPILTVNGWKKAKEEYDYFNKALDDLKKKPKETRRGAYVWVPPCRQASGVRFGYWKRNNAVS